jgi:hypothetical protein
MTISSVARITLIIILILNVANGSVNCDYDDKEEVVDFHVDGGYPPYDILHIHTTEEPKRRDNLTMYKELSILTYGLLMGKKAAEEQAKKYGHGNILHQLIIDLANEAKQYRDKVDREGWDVMEEETINRFRDGVDLLYILMREI